MDLPDIETIVQWKATCDLCTLWQHFRHVARGDDRVGTAILLVEKKDTVEEWVAKAERAAKHKKKGPGLKRKATDGGNNRAKCPALADQSPNQLEEGNASNSESLASLPQEMGDATNPSPVQVAKLAFKDKQQGHYSKQEKKNTGNSLPRGKGHAEVEVGSPMDDFINAQVHCRRIIPEVYFGNDQTRALSVYYSYTASYHSHII